MLWALCAVPLACRQHIAPPPGPTLQPPLARSVQVLDTVDRRLPPEPRRELHLLLRLLGSRVGSLLLLGRASFGCAASVRTGACIGGRSPPLQARLP